MYTGPSPRGKRWNTDEPQRWGCTRGYKQAGVYIIREDQRVVYVGLSKQDVRKRMYRKFEVTRNYRYDRVCYRDRITLHTYEVAIVIAPDQEERELIEAHLIALFNPRDNKQTEIIELLEVPEEFRRIPDEDVPF